MVSVSGVGGIAAAARTDVRRAQPGFALPANADLRPAAAVSGPQAIGGMLALQEREGDAARDRGARRHGQALLNELAALQRALLDGRHDPAALQRLAALSRAQPDTSDPQLGAVIRSVALRAAIELARRGM